MKKLLFLLFALFPFLAGAQNVTVKITLNAIEGGVHANMSVTLMNTETKEKFTGTTNASGIVSIDVPANASYEMIVPNYTGKKIINVPNAPGATMSSTHTYSRNMVEQDKAFAMNDQEKSGVDAFANGLPDTTYFNGGNPFRSVSSSHYVSLELSLRDLNDGPLKGETVVLTGRKRNKSFKGVTGSDGSIMLYLPKGDEYDLSFYYHKKFEHTECKYSKGTSEQQWEFEYIGTKELTRQKKEEAERQERERKEAAEAMAKARLQKAASREQNLNKPYSENGVAEVFDRNQFKNPLVICDASSDMELITSELMGWFAKNAQNNPGAQFVFFNDGDRKKHDEKKIGSTGGLYYTTALPLDKLRVFMYDVIDKSNEVEDGPDNYVEALIEGVKMAKQPYGDIILIVDNHATARDIEMLSQFNKPVHVVVFCSIRGGCDHSFCQPDFLKIAWKTKGTLHINDTDYNEIGNMRSGETITIGTGSLKLVNGEFFRL